MKRDRAKPLGQSPSGTARRGKAPGGWGKAPQCNSPENKDVAKKDSPEDYETMGNPLEREVERCSAIEKDENNDINSVDSPIPIFNRDTIKHASKTWNDLRDVKNLEYSFWSSECSSCIREV